MGVYFSTQLFLNQFTISLLITLTSLSGIFGEFLGGLLMHKSFNLGFIFFGGMLFLLLIFGKRLKLGQ